MPLTVLQVRNAKPGRHADGKGLYLLVKPSGAKSWVLRVQHAGQRRDFGLGSVLLERRHPVDVPMEQLRELTLAEARDKAAHGRALAKAGIDPSAAWRREQQPIPTFRHAARRYHGEVRKAWRNGKHGDQWINTLETYAFPTLGEKRVDEIGAPDIQAVLLPIWLEKPETARRVRQRISTVLDYAKGQNWRPTEAPTRAVNQLLKAIKQPRKGNFAAMPWQELPTFFGRLRAAQPSVGRLALQFAILTAGRSGEVRGATWSEIDLGAAEWRIPPERMKRERLHIVPLVPAAIVLLHQVRELFGGAPESIVFPGAKGQPLSDATITKALRVAGGGSYTVHGFRSTFRDWAADHGYADAWAEAALAHGVEDKTEAAYRRTTFFTQRKEKLMPAWARYALGETSNVIALVEKRG